MRTVWMRMLGLEYDPVAAACCTAAAVEKVEGCAGGNVSEAARGSVSKAARGVKMNEGS